MLDADVIAWIRSGLEDSELVTADELIDEIQGGAFHVLKYAKGCVVFRFTEHFGRRRLLVFLISGSDLDEWKERATQDLKTIARMGGANAIDAYGRLGLEKKLAPIGWKKKAAVLELRV